MPIIDVCELGSGQTCFDSELDGLLARAMLAAPPEWLALLGEIDEDLRRHAINPAVLRSSAKVLALARRGDLTHVSRLLVELSRWSFVDRSISAPVSTCFTGSPERLPGEYAKPNTHT